MLRFEHFLLLGATEKLLKFTSKRLNDRLANTKLNGRCKGTSRVEREIETERERERAVECIHIERTHFSYNS